MWNVKYTDSAKADLKRLDTSQRIQVLKAISRVAQNPLPKNEGGYGSPLGSHNQSNLTGFCKIKLKKIGIRVIYQIVYRDNDMVIIVIGMRSDAECYRQAVRRLPKK